MVRGLLSDEEWALFAPVVIEQGPKRGRPPADHRRVLDAVFEGKNPTMTAIIPSYKEDRRVIRQTLLFLKHLLCDGPYHHRLLCDSLDHHSSLCDSLDHHRCIIAGH